MTGKQSVHSGNVDNVQFSHQMEQPLPDSVNSCKTSEEREDVWSIRRVLAGEISVSKALAQTGFAPSPPKSTQIASPEEMAK